MLPFTKINKNKKEQLLHNHLFLKNYGQLDFDPTIKISPLFRIYYPPPLNNNPHSLHPRPPSPPYRVPPPTASGATTSADEPHQLLPYCCSFSSLAIRPLLSSFSSLASRPAPPSLFLVSARTTQAAMAFVLLQMLRMLLSEHLLLPELLFLSTSNVVPCMQNVAVAHTPRLT